MKYKFITILHHMKIDVKLNKGIQLYPGTRISNGEEVRSEILNSILMQSTAGVHSVDEFNDTVYYYKYGEFPEISSMEEMGKKGTMTTFAFLREAQSFVTDLWLVKDNGIYVRDGFLITYKDSIEDGRSFKASLGEIFKVASCEEGISEFTRNEIDSAIQTFTPISLDEIKEETFGGKYPESNHFYKKGNPGRMFKAQYFTMGARTSHALPMKIVLYCTALECLFSTAKSEINHRIAERVAALMGASAQEKIDIYNFIKKAYNYRSVILHGSNISGSEEDLVEFSVRLDNILRQLILADHEVFQKIIIKLMTFS
ncbi:HEPN domain-containing protein [Cytobacillus oceanisediminis]|uniref:HEPN domain-containing protein n=1 Tax=Cytobacillus oceanisediminis TaxID=665099 RepID=UPI001FB47330|nr:HEPN domain-containing protein [Cytobacillus oceanisediminis]UOE54909.1 hypothetical protein IRB79_24520 [Cytobacillus oceanisediminis]